MDATRKVHHLSDAVGLHGAMHTMHADPAQRHAADRNDTGAHEQTPAGAGITLPADEYWQYLAVHTITRQEYHRLRGTRMPTTPRQRRTR